ncbi:acyl-CoA dehydrogenase [Hirschia baltica]|uniref:Acyl-CoA dehydrogenase domain protein n=1 Tax=Hirschia baltica (strain ATCC 49814 / DSM 5838 / IFAM 1418) TaxID=582402 RepID=C6XQZ4_HIRBI|nr:acyl-CoA dehydrogenase [Hirschia baltica]ACT60525.1 acyl-CoA dehydrogenase domain protein [Hirschia baltica ATCC 49814]
MSLITNRRDIDFLMYELLDLDQMLQTDRYEAYDREAISAILDTAQAIAEDKYLTCASELDANEPTFDGEKVSIMPEVGEALKAFADAGFFGASFDEDVGGAQLPGIVNFALAGFFSAANPGINSYAFLTIGAANMLNAVGSQEQKDKYLGPMLEGRWFGTMCLSEPQAGSSLSDIRTKATPTDEGHYLIEGSKMWISGGDHELAENIVEMVLAKIPGGPPGVRGISLFIVPKYRVNDDGSLGPKNDISLAGLNHKMGHRGTTNCLLNFGENGDCHGYLVGKPHEGLKSMFHMMNEARIGVGQGSVMSALTGFLYSLKYAGERSQGRHPQDKDPTKPQIPIIEHTDIKRLLMAQKAAVEGASALLFYCMDLVEQQKLTDDKNEQMRLALLLEILTPLAKSWPSEFCLEANKHAIQILGGYGYTREFPVERYYRDNRLNHIHEGTHAIHGLDLLGRKVSMHDGAALNLLMAEVQKTLAEVAGETSLKEYATALTGAVETLLDTTKTVKACENQNIQLANATIYLDAFGHVVVAWLWLRQAQVSVNALKTAEGDDVAFYQGKIAACRYFFRYELPKAVTQFHLVADLDQTCLDLVPEQLIGSNPF